MSAILNLDKYRDLFKDSQALKQFALLLEEATEDTSMRLVVFEDEVLGAVIPPEEAESRLRERIMQRLSKNPAILDKLKERLESDDLVD